MSKEMDQSLAESCSSASDPEPRKIKQGQASVETGAT